MIRRFRILEVKHSTVIVSQKRTVKYLFGIIPYWIGKWKNVYVAKPAIYHPSAVYYFNSNFEKLWYERYNVDDLIFMMEKHQQSGGVVKFFQGNHIECKTGVAFNNPNFHYKMAIDMAISGLDKTKSNLENDIFGLGEGCKPKQ